MFIRAAVISARKTTCQTKTFLLSYHQYKWIRLLLSPTQTFTCETYIHTYIDIDTDIDIPCELLLKNFLLQHLLLLLLLLILLLLLLLLLLTYNTQCIRRIEIIWRTDSINWQIGKCQALCFDSGFHQFIIKLNYFWMISYYNWYWHCRWLTDTHFNDFLLQCTLRATHYTNTYMYCTLLCWYTEFSQEFIRFFPSPHSLCSWFWRKCIWFCTCIFEDGPVYMYVINWWEQYNDSTVSAF